MKLLLLSRLGPLDIMSVPRSDILEWFSNQLPPAATHLQLEYHTARRPLETVTRVVLSVTPTNSVYSQSCRDSLVFLHRPWGLDHRRISACTTVIASHNRLDELLTTGHNEPVMQALGVEQPFTPIIGYKGDPERKMGLIGPVPSYSLSEWLARLVAEFDGIEGYAFNRTSPESRPRMLACMNAFDPDIIQRAQEAAHENCIAMGDNFEPHQLLFLTGEPRPAGAARAAELCMPVIYVGHRRSEMWALRYLASRLQTRFPGLEAIIIDEPEEPRNPPRSRAAVQQNSPNCNLHA